MPNRAVTIVGLVADQLKLYFDPELSVPPLGGGTDTVHILAGDTVSPPWLEGDDGCDGCGPYLWVRLVKRWRTEDFPSISQISMCTTAQAVTVEAGIARCYPYDPDEDDQTTAAMVQLDDSYRLDAALCAAMRAAEDKGIAVNTALGAGDPYGPNGLLIAWTQQAHAQLT